VPSDTTWSHFSHLRLILEQFGLPACLYTDGLACSVIVLQQTAWTLTLSSSGLSRPWAFITG